MPTGAPAPADQTAAAVRLRAAARGVAGALWLTAGAVVRADGVGPTAAIEETAAAVRHGATSIAGALPRHAAALTVDARLSVWATAARDQVPAAVRQVVAAAAVRGASARFAAAVFTAGVVATAAVDGLPARADLAAKIRGRAHRDRRYAGAVFTSFTGTTPAIQSAAAAVSDLTALANGAFSGRTANAVETHAVGAAAVDLVASAVIKAAAQQASPEFRTSVRPKPAALIVDSVAAADLAVAAGSALDGLPTAALWAALQTKLLAALGDADGVAAKPRLLTAATLAQGTLTTIDELVAAVIDGAACPAQFRASLWDALALPGFRVARHG